MAGKRGFEMSWSVIISIIILVGLLALYLVFSGVGAKSIGNALNYFKELFRFGG